MHFTVKSEEELQQEKFKLSVGDADFEILTAEETTSPKGNPMLKLNVQLWDKNGKQGILFDYLVSHVSWKIKQFCESINQLEVYESGDIDPNILIGKTGKCVLNIQKGTPQYPNDKIRITEYLPYSEKVKELNDDIPF